MCVCVCVCVCVCFKYFREYKQIIYWKWAHFLGHRDITNLSIEKKKEFFLSLSFQRFSCQNRFLSMLNKILCYPLKKYQLKF